MGELGADFGFDGNYDLQGACRGAVGLVKSRKTIDANDNVHTAYNTDNEVLLAA